MVSPLTKTIRQCAGTLMSGVEGMRDTWLVDETLYRHLCSLYPKLEANETFTRASMVRALAGLASDSFDSKSPTHIYRKMFSLVCPYGGKQRRIHYYYRSTDGAIPRAPAEASEIDDPYVRSHRVLAGRHRATEGEKERARTAQTDDALKKLAESDKKKAEQTPKKIGEDDKPMATPSPAQKNKETINPGAWFDVRKNARMFGYDPNEIDGRSFLRKRMEELETAVKGGHDAIYSIVEHKGHPLSPDQARRVERKAMFLIMAYKIGLDRLGRDIVEEDLRDKKRDEKNMRLDGTREPQMYRWVEHCCKPAVEVLNQAHINDITNAEVLRRLNFMFSKNGGKFPHPNPNIAADKKNTPKLLEFFPEAVTYIKKFVTENLATFSCALLDKELENKIIPALIKDAKGVPGYESSPGYHLLQQFEEKPATYGQVYRWVKYLGYTMDGQKKSYYVDGHEKPEQREHRNLLTAKYLAELEPYCHRWVQITEEKYQMLALDELKDLLINGHQYEDPGGQWMREFHVDDHEKFQEIGNEVNPKFGGK